MELINRGQKFLLNFIIALQTTIFSISYATIIFSGILAPLLPHGIGAALFSSVILGTMISLLSAVPCIVAQPQHIVSALIGLMANNIALSLHEQGLDNQVLPTILFLIVLCTLLMGLLFVVIGYFHLAKYVRFIPYPVIGGVIAGIGWILMMKSLSMMTGHAFDLSTLFGERLFKFILPGLIFGGGLYYMAKKSLVSYIPVWLVIALALFYLIFWLQGIPVTDEWLITQIPAGHLWPSPLFYGHLQINGDALIGQWGHMAVLVITGVLYFLMTSSGLEMVLHRDLNMDWEFKSSGFANLVAGLGGGLPGYQTFNLSSFSYRAGASKHVGVFCGLLAFLGLVTNLTFLNYVPKFIVGGFVLFFGLSLFADWAFDKRKSLPVFDYVLVLTIPVVIALLGFMPGVIVGVAIAIAKFIFEYSQTNVIKYQLSGNVFHSNVDRSPAQRAVLQKYGDQIIIIKLQGYIFFGTSYLLLDQIKARLAGIQAFYLVLDFRSVTNIDSSTVYSFMKLTQLIQGKQITLVLTEVREAILRQFLLGGVLQAAGDQIHLFASLDAGVEWCENAILAREHTFEEVACLPPSLKEILPFLTKMSFPAGEHLIRHGESTDDFFIIDSGHVSSVFEQDGKTIRLRTMGPGTLVGELGFFLHTPRTTSVVTEQPTVVYRMNRKNMETLMKQRSDLVIALQEYVIFIMGERLINTDKTIEFLVK